MTEQAHTRGRTLTGRVVSDAMDKTVVVEVTRRVKHRRYKKYINRSSRYAAHDEDNIFAVNDVVLIRESRPLSKTKRWRVVGKANG